MGCSSSRDEKVNDKSLIRQDKKDNIVKSNCNCEEDMLFYNKLNECSDYLVNNIKDYSIVKENIHTDDDIEDQAKEVYEKYFKTVRLKTSPIKNKVNSTLIEGRKDSLIDNENSYIENTYNKDIIEDTCFYLYSTKQIEGLLIKDYTFDFSTLNSLLSIDSKKDKLFANITKQLGNNIKVITLSNKFFFDEENNKLKLEMLFLSIKHNQNINTIGIYINEIILNNKHNLIDKCASLICCNSNIKTIALIVDNSIDSSSIFINKFIDSLSKSNIVNLCISYNKHMAQADSLGNKFLASLKKIKLESLFLNKLCFKQDYKKVFFQEISKTQNKLNIFAFQDDCLTVDNASYIVSTLSKLPELTTICVGMDKSNIYDELSNELSLVCNKGKEGKKKEVYADYIEI